MLNKYVYIILYNIGIKFIIIKNSNLDITPKKKIKLQKI